MPRRRRSRGRSRATDRTNAEKGDHRATSPEPEVTEPVSAKVSGTGRPRGRPRKKQAPEPKSEPRRTTRTRSSSRAKQCLSCAQERGASSTRQLRARENRPVYTDVSSSSEEPDDQSVPADSPAQKIDRKPSLIRTIIHRSAIERVTARSRVPSSSSSEDFNLRLSEGESNYGGSVNEGTTSSENSNLKNPSPTSTTEDAPFQSTSLLRQFYQSSNPPISVMQTSLPQSVSTSIPSPSLFHSPRDQTTPGKSCSSSTSISEDANQNFVEDDEFIEAKLNVPTKIEPEVEIVLASEFIHDVEQALLRTKFRFKVYVENENAIANGVEIRILDIDLNGPSMFECLSDELRSKFTNLVGKNFTIYWRDAEDDAITVTDSGELETALKVMKNNPVVKFYVKVLGANVNSNSSD